MAPAFSADIIARVKDETDIVEIVRQHVNLKQAGSVFKGLCPFHKEKTPSFIVTPARQRYHCFGCGTGGDVISFLMEVEGISFPEAVEILARPLDIDLSSWLREEEGEGERRSFHRANEAAAKIWQEALWDPKTGKEALRYLQDRGFGEKVLRDFDVGWAPGGSGWLAERLARAGVDEDLARRADLVRQGERGGAFAYFRNRIIFPVKNISRQVAGFGGRIIDRGEPKYLNSSDSTYFSKGKLLYGFDASRMAISREKTAVLVEGYFDLLALVQAGIGHVVATCGTAFTVDQARLIRRGAPNVLLVFDGDKAGLKAAVRSADTALRSGLEPRIVRLPEGRDPADIVTEDGPEAARDLLRWKDAKGYVPFLKELADARGGDRQVAERALRQVLGTIAGITDPLRREYVLQEAADEFKMEPDLLRESLPQETRDRRAGAGSPSLSARTTRAEAPAEPTGTAPPRETCTGRDEPAGLRVKRAIGLPNVARQEAELLEHVLRDDSGEAARVFLAERGDLTLRTAGAETLAAELSTWAEVGKDGTRTPPRDFILDRWNLSGDGEYRGFVSRLLNKEDVPDQADFTKVVRDCLSRLRRGHQPRGD